MILLLAIATLVIGTMVWLVGWPSWRGGLEAVASVVFLMVFGPALGRWAGASVRRTLVLALGMFVATFCVEAFRSGLPVLEWRGLVGLVAISLTRMFGLLVILAILSLVPASHVPGRSAKAIGGGDMTEETTPRR